MASSRDAVRNFVYDVHLYNLKKGWLIVQQLEEKELDSWEQIHNAFPVQEPNDAQDWTEDDDLRVSEFAKACPLLGEKLAAQLAAQAALFVSGGAVSTPRLRQRCADRLGSLPERMSRLYLRGDAPPKPPTPLRADFRNSLRIRVGGEKNGLVPFAEAVAHPGFFA